MKYLSIIIILILKCNFFYAQEIVSNEKIKLSSRPFYSYPIIDSSKNEVLLFFIDDKKVQTHIYDNQFRNKTDETLEFERPPKRYSPVGHSIAGEYHNIVFLDQKGKNFLAQSINTNTNESTQKEFKLKKEILIETISVNNKFYSLTYMINDRLLNIYQFENQSFSLKKAIDFNTVINKIDNEEVFHRMFDMNENGFRLKSHIRKINLNNINSFPTASSLFKLYYSPNEIILSIDDLDQGVVLLAIDLQDFNHETSQFYQIDTDCDRKQMSSSNSFVKNDLVYQIKTCHNRLILQISNRNTHSILKTIDQNVDTGLTIANTSVIQKSGTPGFSNEPIEIRKEKRKFRSLSNNIGIYPNVINDIIEITIGSFDAKGINPKEIIYTNSPVNDGIITKPKNNSSQLAFTDALNASYFYLKKLEYSKTITFKTHLDKNLNYLKTKERYDLFDKISKYEKDLNMKKVYAQNIISIDNEYYFIYFLKNKNEYFIVKFS